MPKTQTGIVRLIRKCQRKSVPCKLALASKLQRIPSPQDIHWSFGGGSGRELIEVGATEGQFARELVIARQAGKPRELGSLNFYPL